jgi:hypothetical protein
METRHLPKTSAVRRTRRRIITNEIPELRRAEIEVAPPREADLRKEDRNEEMERNKKR